MSYKDRQNYKVPWHDYDLFSSCFGLSKIMPTDLDFIVEVKNKFLCLELKQEHKKIFIGQFILLQKLSKIPNFTVAVLYHKPRIKCNQCGSIHDIPEFTAMSIYPKCKLKSIDNTGVKAFVKHWYEAAIYHD